MKSCGNESQQCRGLLDENKRCHGWDRAPLALYVLHLFSIRNKHYLLEMLEV